MAADERRDVARVLVPVDGTDLSGVALPWVIPALRDGGELTLVAVIPPTRVPVAPVSGSEELAAQGRSLRRRVAQGLEELADRVTAAAPGATVDVEIVPGEPAPEITRMAAERGVDLVVMATHGRGAAGRFAHGSVADAVARTATVPVLMVRGGDDAPAGPIRPAPVTRLVVLLDGSTLADGALPVSGAVARKLGVPVALLTVTGHGGVTGATAAETQRHAAGELGPDVATERVTVSGDVVPAVVAATGPGDILVLVSHARSGLSRLVSGSVAEGLIRQAAAPVLLVRPPVT